MCDGRILGGRWAWVLKVEIGGVAHGKRPECCHVRHVIPVHPKNGLVHASIGRRDTVVFPTEVDAQRGGIMELPQGRFGAPFGDICSASRVKRREESACHNFGTVGPDHVTSARQKTLKRL